MCFPSPGLVDVLDIVVFDAGRARHRGGKGTECDGPSKADAAVTPDESFASSLLIVPFDRPIFCWNPTCNVGLPVVKHAILPSC